MTDLIGSIIGMFLVGFILAPVIFTVYILFKSKIDIDGDGKNDVPNRWQNNS